MALKFRPAADSPDDHQAMQGEWQVGQIDKRPSFTGTLARYFWILNGVPAGPKGLSLAGGAGTLDEAKAELNKSWEEWLAWAALSSDVKD
jgi:hypothetical protein